jgi:ribosome-binding factor A
MARSRQQPRQYPRVARVNEVVLECLADELERLSDPRLGFVTLTGVEVSPDLRTADVYYSVMGAPEQHAETATALQSAAPHLRAVLGRQVRMKYLPDLRFREDPSVAGGERIDEIIRDLHVDAERGDDPRDRRRRGRTR